MSTFSLPAVVCSALCLLAAPLDETLTEAQCDELIETIASELEAGYIFEDAGLEMADGLRGAVESLRNDSPAEFAEAITRGLQEITGDLHLRVFPPSDQVRRARSSSPAGMRANNYGLKRVEVLDGNVGYIDVRGFSGEPEALERIDAAMAFLTDVDAMILDLRSNGGGTNSSLVRLASYFLPADKLLHSVQARGEETMNIVTEGDLPHPKLLDVPLFVLTSRRTFSAAEAFTFSIRMTERGTIVGENTGGGGHFGGVIDLPHGFSIFVPMGRAFDRSSGEGFEGRGVQPHVATTEHAAMQQAHDRAMRAADERRERQEPH
jgi:hypothetical protein